MAAKLLGLRSLGAVVLSGAPVIALTNQVYASDDDTASNMVRIKELPIYGNPEDGYKYEFIEEEITGLRQQISHCRQFVWKGMERFQTTRDKVKASFAMVKETTTETITFIQNDPSILPRAGVITVAGLGGVVAGYKGGYVRKAAFGSLAALAATSLCYPNQAVDLSKEGYTRAVVIVKEAWGTRDGVVKPIQPPVKEEKPSEKKPVVVDDSKVDMGQSNPEDKDLYTTRGS